MLRAAFSRGTEVLTLLKFVLSPPPARPRALGVSGPCPPTHAAARPIQVEKLLESPDPGQSHHLPGCAAPNASPAPVPPKNPQSLGNTTENAPGLGKSGSEAVHGCRQPRGLPRGAGNRSMPARRGRSRLSRRLPAFGSTHAHRATAGGATPAFRSPARGHACLGTAPRHLGTLAGEPLPARPCQHHRAARAAGPRLCPGKEARIPAWDAGTQKLPDFEERGQPAVTPF